MLFCYPEEFSYEFGSVSEVLLNQLRADYSKEGRGCLVGDGFGEKRLSRSRYTIKNNTLGRFDAHFFV